MRKKQLVQLLQFIVIWSFVGCFIVFVEKQSFVEFLLKYRWYFLITSVSYFYYYSIQYELGKKYESVRNIILYGNLYLFLHLFFRPLLNISHELFIMLGLIIWGIYGTTKMKSRRKYLLQILGGIISFLILISGVIYLYPEKPDIDGFIRTRNYQLSVFGATEEVEKKDAYIQIKQLEKIDNFEIVPNLSKVLSGDCKIAFPSRERDMLEKVVIVTPKGDVVRLLPQTEISLEFSGDVFIISDIVGKVGFLTGLFNSNIQINGDVIELSEEQQNWMYDVQNEYGYDLITYLKNQILEDNQFWIDNPIMNNLEGYIIGLLVKVFPATFTKNFYNYNEYQKYFKKFTDKLNGSISFVNRIEFGDEGVHFWKNLKDNIIVGKRNIYFKLYK